MQERHNFIANALDLHLSCTNPSNWWNLNPGSGNSLVLTRQQVITWTDYEDYQDLWHHWNSLGTPETNNFPEQGTKSCSFHEVYVIVFFFITKQSHLSVRYGDFHLELVAMNRPWMNNYIHYYCMWIVITHPCPNLNNGLTRSPLKSVHGWVITSHCFTWM